MTDGQREDFAKDIHYGVGDESMWKLRLFTAEVVGTGFSAYGSQLIEQAKKENNSDIIAYGIILKMAADLVLGIEFLIEKHCYYAAAALMRQMVEIEYLVWAFNEGNITPTMWLNSTHQQRLKLFAPRVIRQTSRGRFLDIDYQGHCEMGGHPTPKGAGFLADNGQKLCQVFLADVIIHGWRVWDEFKKWVSNNSVAQTMVASMVPLHQAALLQWAKKDEIYRAMVERYPVGK